MKHIHNNSLLFIAIVSLFLMGASCEVKNIIIEESDSEHKQDVEQYSHDIEVDIQDEVEVEAKKVTCIKENKRDNGPGSCCEGLEPVAVDHAFSACQKIGTKGWEAGGCTELGGVPYVSEQCCEGLTPVIKDDVVICE